MDTRRKKFDTMTGQNDVAFVYMYTHEDFCVAKDEATPGTAGYRFSSHRWLWSRTPGIRRGSAKMRSTAAFHLYSPGSVRFSMEKTGGCTKQPTVQNELHHPL